MMLPLSQTSEARAKKIEHRNTIHRHQRPSFAAYRKAAHRAGRVFELTREQFSILVRSLCSYCNEPGMNGVDRKDNSIGYTAENCVSSCKTCNHAKGALPYDEWMAWIARFKR